LRCGNNFRLFCSDDCRSWPREEKINNHGYWGKHAHIPDNDYWGICLFHVVWTNFFGNYSYYLILTKINCITLKFRSKADFKSKSQNIWQQIFLSSRTVMQMICALPKIWTLFRGDYCPYSAVKNENWNKNIFRVYHIRIIAKKIGSHDMKQTDSSIIIVRNVCVLTSVSMIENICCQIFCDLLLKSAFERNFNVMQLILVKIKWYIKWKYLIQKFHDICLSYYFKKKQQKLSCNKKRIVCDTWEDTKCHLILPYVKQL
jgi:hypothetical protein